MNNKIENFQNKLEMVPRVSPEALFLLNDFAKKITDKQDLSDQERRTIGEIYTELQPLEQQLIYKLKDYENLGLLSNLEQSVLAASYLAAKQLGSSVEYINNAFMILDDDPEVFDQKISTISLPRDCFQIISEAYRKVKNSFKEIK